MMSDFLNNLGRAASETAKKAMKASGNVVELTKTSLNIKFDEIKRDSFFREIGKRVYCGYKKCPEGATCDILELCACIDEIEHSIKAQKTKAAHIQNKKFCVDCGIVLAKSVRFCYSCGAKQPEIVEEEDCCDCCCCCPPEEEDEAEDCCCCDCEEENEAEESCGCEEENKTE